MNHIELGQLVLRRLRESRLPNSVIMDFVGVSEVSVNNWKRGVARGQEIQPPRGELLNRLWRLLAATGTPSPELKELESFHFLLGHLLAFGVITLGEAQDICGGVGTQSVLETIRGTRTPVKRTREAEELQEEYGARLLEAEARLEALVNQVRHNNGLPPLSVVSFTRLAPSTPAPTPAAIKATRQETPPARRETLLLELAMDLASVLPALRYLLSDKCTVEQREEFRELAGRDNLHMLGVLVHGLISERTVQLTRETLRNQEGR